MRGGQGFKVTDYDIGSPGSDFGLCTRDLDHQIVFGQCGGERLRKPKVA